MNFTIACDPELLLLDKLGSFRSAIGVIPGSKEDPLQTDSGGVLHYDNVTAEFSTVPATDSTSFDANVAAMIGEVEAIATANDLLISDQSFAIYSEDQLTPDEAKMAGCQPDFCAYSGVQNDPPEYDSTQERAAGGHIHIGWDGFQGEEDIQQFIRCLDFLIGVPAVKHESGDRKRLYGQAGAYRVKPYGVEYRTPSNWWVFSSERRQWVYDRVNHALEVFRDLAVPRNVPLVVNSNDEDAAQAMMLEYNLVECPA